MAYKTITSATNPLIKSIVKLHDTQQRKHEKRFIVEGKRALSTALTHLLAEHIICTDALLPYAHMLSEEGKIIVVPESLMKKISASKTPSGILGVLTIPQEPLPNALTPGLVLAHIQNPGNMGTLIRTAVACQVSSVVIVEGCDPWSPKVVQASAGTLGTLNIFQWSWEQLLRYKKELMLYALVVEGGTTPDHIIPNKALLVIGNEARGLSKEWIASCDTLITLPMPGTAESLNAAVAGSITTYLTFCKKQ